MTKPTETEEALRGVLATEIREYLQTGGKMNMLALRAVVSSNTISRIYYGETRWPRLHTIVALLDALGYDLKAVKRG